MVSRLYQKNYQRDQTSSTETHVAGITANLSQGVGIYVSFEHDHLVTNDDRAHARLHEFYILPFFAPNQQKNERIFEAMMTKDRRLENDVFTDWSY